MRPVNTYTLLTAMVPGLVGQTAPATAQSAAEQIRESVALTVCVIEASQALHTNIEVIGKDGKLVFVVPAPAPYTGKFDGCVVHEDGAMTNLKGAEKDNNGQPVAGRPACQAAIAVLSCVDKKLAPKAGS